MNIGMLWFDNDQKVSIPKKVARAAAYYQQKYGKDPDLCFVHPRMFQQQENQGTKQAGKMDGSSQEPMLIGKIRVLENEKVLPDHFWIGVSTEEEWISSGE